MNKTNLEIIYTIAQNLTTSQEDLLTHCDTSAWRIVDCGCGGMIIANDAAQNLPNGVTSVDTEVLSVAFDQTNHSGLGWDSWEDYINYDEIITDITFTKDDVTFCEETGDFLSSKVVYEKVIPKPELAEYGFTFEYLVINECGCGDSSTFPCGTDVSTLGVDTCKDCKEYI